jgi:hypothetical protein
LSVRRQSVSAAVSAAGLYALVAAVRWAYPAVLPSVISYLQLVLLAAVAGTTLWVIRTRRGWARRSAVAAALTALVLRACALGVDRDRIFERAPQLYDAAAQVARKNLPPVPGCVSAVLPDRLAETSRQGQVVVCRGPGAEEFVVFVADVYFVGEYRGFMYYRGSVARPSPWVVPWTPEYWSDPAPAPGPELQHGWARLTRPHWYRVGT